MPCYPLSSCLGRCQNRTRYLTLGTSAAHAKPCSLGLPRCASCQLVGRVRIVSCGAPIPGATLCLPFMCRVLQSTPNYLVDLVLVAISWVASALQYAAGLRLRTCSWFSSYFMWCYCDQYRLPDTPATPCSLGLSRCAFCQLVGPSAPGFAGIGVQLSRSLWVT